MLESFFVSKNTFLVSTVKASTAVEDFSIVASCYPCPTFPEVIFGMILFFTPLFALALIVERTSLYRRISKQIRAFRNDEHAAAQDFLTGKSANNSEGKKYISEVVSKSLRESDLSYTNQSRPRIQIEQSRQRAIALKRIEFEKGLGVIETIAITMPLLCLFGGSVSLMEDISWMRYAEGQSIWAISLAIENVSSLLAIGLGVAIPTFWMHRLLSLKSKRLTAELDDASARLLDLVLNYQPRPWLLEPKSSADTSATQSFSRSTSEFTLNRQA